MKQEYSGSPFGGKQTFIRLWQPLTRLDYRYWNWVWRIGSQSTRTYIRLAEFGPIYSFNWVIFGSFLHK